MPDSHTTSIPRSFAIELARGVCATVYLASSLTAGDFLELHHAVERLPCTAAVLRIQVTHDIAERMPIGLGAFVRHWREVRRRPVHLVFVPPRAPVPNAPVGDTPANLVCAITSL